MEIHTLFFDLDNTLYPKSSGLMDAIRNRIIDYMRDEMKLDNEEISSIREYSLKRYGTTLVGLIELYGIDQQYYLEYVHSINLQDYLKPDPETTKTLQALPQRKFIFSNADSNHIHRVLDYLGVRDFFEGIIDVHQLMPYVKPKPEAFERALVAAGMTSWDGCAFIDDYLPNILTAEKKGIYSILIDENSESHYKNCIPSIYFLKDLLNSKGI